MEILNIGPLELIIILVIMFVLLGPREMILTAYRIGKFIRGVVRSPMWKEVIGYSQEIRELPKKLLDETQLDETLAEVKKTTREAADELKAQLKEASDAARIPDTEEIRRETLASQAAAAQPEIGAPTIMPPVEPAEASVSEPVQPNVPVGVQAGMPLRIYNPPPSPEPVLDLPYGASLRPRRLRAPVNGSAQETPAPAAAQEAAASFAPRSARRASAAISNDAVGTDAIGNDAIAVDGDAGPLPGQNGASNGGAHTLSSETTPTDTAARIVPPVEGTEPRDAAE